MIIILKSYLPKEIHFPFLESKPALFATVYYASGGSMILVTGDVRRREGRGQL